MKEIKFKTWGDVIKDNTEFAEKTCCFMLPNAIQMAMEIDGEKMHVNVNSIALTEYGPVWAFHYDDGRMQYYLPKSQKK